MGALLDTPKTDKDSLTSEGNGLKASATGMQGWRVDMEDAHVCTASIPSHPKHSVFGVFDGHGGKTAAQSSAFNLIKTLERISGYKSAKSMLAWSDIVYRTFFTLDVLLEKELMGGVDKSGCTGVMTIIGPEYIVCGSAGDSRCVLSRGSRAIPLSIDHKPDNVTERQRVRKAGGEVVMGRVNGELAVARSLGDFKYKKKKGFPPEAQAVTCMPDVRAIERTSFDEFVVLACDGVWDVMSSQEVVDFVHKEIAQGVLDPTAITGKLLDHCLANQSRDNMTACLVLFLENLKSPASTQDGSLEFSPMHVNDHSSARAHSPIVPAVEPVPSTPRRDKPTPRILVTDTVASLDCDESSRPVSPHVRTSMNSSRPASARSPKSGALFTYSVPTSSTSPIISDAPSAVVTLPLPAPVAPNPQLSTVAAVSEHTRSNSLVVPSSPRIFNTSGTLLKRSLSVTKLHEMLGSSGLLVKVPSLYDPVKKVLEIDKEIEEKAEQLVGAKSKAFESGTSVGGRQKPSLTLDSSEDDSDSAKDPFADDGEYDWGGVGDDAIVPDGQDYGIIPDLASCLPRNSPSLKGYLPVLEAHRLPAKHGRRAVSGMSAVAPAAIASPYVNGGPGGPRSKVSRSKLKPHPSVSFEGTDAEPSIPRSPSGRDVKVMAPVRGGDLQSKPHLPLPSHQGSNAPSATPLAELRMRYGVPSPHVNVAGHKQPSSRTRIPSAGKARPAIPSARSKKPPLTAEAEVFSFQDVEGVLSIKPAPITPALPPVAPPVLVSENSVHRLAGSEADVFTGLSISDAIDIEDGFTIAPAAKLPSPIAQLEFVHVRTPTKPVKSSRAVGLSRGTAPVPLNDVVITNLTPARRDSRDLITPVDGDGRVPMSTRSHSDDRQYTLAPMFQDPVSSSAPTVEAEFLEAIKGISNKKRSVKSAKHHVTGSGASFGSATPTPSAGPSSANTPVGEIAFSLPPLAAVRSSGAAISKSSPAAPLDSHRNTVIAEHGKDLIAASFGGVAASHLSRAGRFAVDKL